MGVTVMVWFVVCAALLSAVTSVTMFIYWGRDKPARRTYRDAAYVAVGVVWGLFALGRYLGHMAPGWMVWLYAALAVATPFSIWEARRKDARNDALKKEWD
jgi:4-hydroxybenzoate polyprenyltransferase